VNRTHSELSCLVLNESVAVLGGAQDAEAELDAREILDQRRSSLPGCRARKRSSSSSSISTRVVATPQV